MALALTIQNLTSIYGKSPTYETIVPVSGVGISNVVEDTTPQLGGNLDLNSKDITGTGNINLTGNIQLSGNLLLDSTHGFKVRPSVGTASNYGTVEMQGSGTGGFYGIKMDQWIVMANGTNWGLYDDTNNKYGLIAYPNAATHMYYNGTQKVSTTNTGANIVGALTATGEIEAFDTSDIRLKGMIKDLDPKKALEAIKKWRAVKYWHKKKRQMEIGFIAQEVEKDYPEAIRHDENGMKMVHYGKLLTVFAAALKANG